MRTAANPRQQVDEHADRFPPMLECRGSGETSSGYLPADLWHNGQTSGWPDGAGQNHEDRPLGTPDRYPERGVQGIGEMADGEQ